MATQGNAALQVPEKDQKASKALQGIPLGTGGLTVKHMGDAWKLASIIHQSGLAPKAFDSPQKVFTGMLMNIELGRPIIGGLQDLAIINGRCGIFGDASLALITDSGLMESGYPKETESGSPFSDSWTFTYKVKRKGRPEATGVWSWAEAKRAGLDNPKTRDGREDRFSPWRRWTRRMMQWKARNFVLRDEFGDVLKGIRSVEELHDYVDMEPQDNGAFQAPEQPREKEPENPFEQSDIEGRFADEIGQHCPAGKLDQFLDVLAQHYGKDALEVKREALDDPHGFTEAYAKWLGQDGDQANDDDPQGGGKPEAESGAEDQAGGEAQNGSPAGEREPELLEQIKNARPGTSERNMQLFRERIMARMDEIRQWPMEYQEQVAQKWTRTYPGEDFWGQVNADKETPVEETPVEDSPASPELMTKVKNVVQSGYKMSAEEAEDFIWTRLGDNPSGREARQVMAEALNKGEE